MNGVVRRKWRRRGITGTEILRLFDEMSPRARETNIPSHSLKISESPAAPVQENCGDTLTPTLPSGSLCSTATRAVLVFTVGRHLVPIWRWDEHERRCGRGERCRSGLPRYSFPPARTGVKRSIPPQPQPAEGHDRKFRNHRDQHPDLRSPEMFNGQSITGDRPKLARSDEWSFPSRPCMQRPLGSPVRQRPAVPHCRPEGKRGGASVPPGAGRLPRTRGAPNRPAGTGRRPMRGRSHGRDRASLRGGSRGCLRGRSRGCLRGGVRGSVRDRRAACGAGAVVLRARPVPSFDGLGAAVEPGQGVLELPHFLRGPVGDHPGQAGPVDLTVFGELGRPPSPVMRSLRAMPPSGSATRSASPQRSSAAVWRFTVEVSSPKASANCPMDMGPCVSIRLSSRYADRSRRSGSRSRRASTWCRESSISSRSSFSSTAPPAPSGTPLSRTPRAARPAGGAARRPHGNMHDT